VAQYRVDELARAADTSVRNVRVYQDRGLLPPPRRVGRTGIYTEAHLARLRLIRLLLQRGYTFATIGELLSAWSQGQGLNDLLHLDGVIAVPWSDETPTRLREADLVAAFGDFTEAQLHRAIEMGFVGRDDDGYQVPSPRLLEAGSQLVAAGVPLSAVLDLAEGLQAASPSSSSRRSPNTLPRRTARRSRWPRCCSSCARSPSRPSRPSWRWR